MEEKMDRNKEKPRREEKGRGQKRKEGWKRGLQFTRYFGGGKTSTLQLLEDFLCRLQIK